MTASGADSEPIYLGTSGCDRLSIRIVGYEFPGDREPGGINSNWLMIRGDIERADTRWSFTDPSLTTVELAELIQWLRELPRPTLERIRFLEPLFAFSVAERDEDAWTVVAELRAEAVPRALRAEDDWNEGIRLSLEVTPRNRDRVVEALEADLRRFPAR